MAAGRSDFGSTGEPMPAVCEVTQVGHDGGVGAGADLGVILGEDHVTDPVV